MRIARRPSLRSFPLALKELHQLAARPRTFVVRLVFMVITYGIFLAAYIALSDWPARGSPAALGRGDELLGIVTGLEFVLIFILLPALLSGTIAQERERNTLQLLLITTLGPGDILFGKFLSRLVAVVVYVALTWPLLGVCYAIGGVEPHELLSAAYVVLISCLQVGALALFFSCLCATSVSAFLSVFIWGSIFYFGPDLLAGLGVISRGTAQLWHPMFPPHLYHAYHAQGFGAVVDRSVHVAISIGVFLIAARILLTRRLHVTRRSVVARSFGGIDRLFEWLNFWKSPGGVSRSRRALPGDDPVRWRELRRAWLAEPRHFARMLIAIEIPILIVGILCYLSHLSSPSPMGQELTGAVLTLWGMAAIVVAILGANLIGREREEETLEILLTTPLAGSAILTGKVAVVERVIRLFYLPFFTLFFLEACAETRSGEPGYPVVGLIYLAVSVVMVPIYLRLLTWISVHVGLRARNRVRAAVGSLAATLLWLAAPFVLMLVNPLFLIVLPFASPLAGILFTELGGLGGQPILFPLGILFLSLNLALHFGLTRMLQNSALRSADRRLGRTSPRVTRDLHRPHGGWNRPGPGEGMPGARAGGIAGESGAGIRGRDHT